MPRSRASAEENLVVPPVAAPLRREALVQQLHLALRDAGRERNVHRRAADVAVPFRDLVGEVELVAEDGGHDLADGPVILVRVVGRRRDDEVGRARSGDVLEDLLHAAPDGGQPAFGQVEQVDGEVRAGHERMRRVARLLLALGGAGQHHVAGPQPALGQAEEQAARRRSRCHRGARRWRARTAARRAGRQGQ